VVVDHVEHDTQIHNAGAIVVKQIHNGGMKPPCTESDLELAWTYKYGHKMLSVHKAIFLNCATSALPLVNMNHLEIPKA
jgi:hypothetical protein